MLPRGYVPNKFMSGRYAGSHAWRSLVDWVKGLLYLARSESGKTEKLAARGEADRGERQLRNDLSLEVNHILIRLRYEQQHALHEDSLQ